MIVIPAFRGPRAIEVLGVPGRAAWLVAARCDGPGWPDFAVADFAPALGEAGLAGLARLVEERRTDSEPGSWAVTWGASSLRKELAALSGDVNAHVAVLAQEARSGRDYGEIVSVLRKAGRNRDAEEWARRLDFMREQRVRANTARSISVS